MAGKTGVETMIPAFLGTKSGRRIRSNYWYQAYGLPGKLMIRGVLQVTFENENGINGIANGRIDSRVLQRAKQQVVPFFVLNNSQHPAARELCRVTILKTARELAAGQVMHHLTPCVPEEIAPLSESAKRENGAPALTNLLAGEVELLSFPNIYYRIVEILEDPKSSAADLSQVVSTDTSLAARLLRLVNSAYYGLASKVDNIPRAIAMVGTNELSSLALGISVVNHFKDIPAELIDMKSFWRHSITCGVFARILAGHKGIRSVERFFVAGLLHDIGRLVLLQKAPLASTRAMVLAQSGPNDMHVAEKEVFGYDHASVGGLLLREWKLPGNLTTMVRFHHRPENAEEVLDASIIHLADVMAVAYGIGYISLELVPGINEKAWEVLGLSTEMFKPAFVKAEDQINDINHIVQSEVVK